MLSAEKDRKSRVALTLVHIGVKKEKKNAVGVLPRALVANRDEPGAFVFFLLSIFFVIDFLAPFGGGASQTKPGPVYA